MVNGFGRLVKWLTAEIADAGGELRLQTEVRRIDWGRGRVSVESDDARYDGTAVLVTVPLGVLQAGVIRFNPDMPGHRDAAGRLAMGSVVRMTIQCRDAFWTRELPSLSFIHAWGEQFPTWWTVFPLRAPLLTAWAGGPRAAALARQPESDRVAAALHSLAAMTGLSPAIVQGQVIAVHSHDWESDPFSRGAYSYVPAEALSAVDALAQPYDGTIFFAGKRRTRRGTLEPFTGPSRPDCALLIRLWRRCDSAPCGIRSISQSTRTLPPASEA